MNDTLTEVICIIDRSGSMNAIRDDAIGGYNAFLSAQRALDGETRWTLALFDHAYELLENGVPIAGARPLDRVRYEPRGTTALLDAVGRTIDEVGRRLHQTPEAERPGKVIVAILTDGYENASTDYTYRDVAQRVEHQKQTYGWQFVFLAAGQDAVLSASRLAIDAKDAIAFQATDTGVQAAFRRMMDAVTDRRSPRGG